MNIAFSPIEVIGADVTISGHFYRARPMNPAFFVRHPDTPTLYAAAKPASLIVVDQGIQDWPYLVSLLPASSAHTEVVILDGGLDQLATHLAHRPAGSLHALHLLCHGRSGGLLLGKQWLTQANLATHADSLRQIGRALATDADWWVYGCEVAQGARGQRFVAELAQWSGAQLAAASTPIGAGHGWTLDVQVGQPSRQRIPAWLTKVANQYRGVLAASHDFDSTTDGGDYTSVATSTTWGWSAPITAIRLTAANGTWRMINDYGYNGIYGWGGSAFTGAWALNTGSSAGSSVTLTADINNDGVFGDAFWLKSLKLADPSNTGGIYTIKPNGASSGQELVEVPSSFTSLASYTPGVTSNFNRVTSVVIQFAGSASGIGLDDIDIAEPSNTAPTISSSDTASVAENAVTSTVVYTASASDAEGDAITYSLSGTDAAAFSIDTAGAVRLLSPADYETQPSYSFTVNAADSYATSSQAVTLSISNVNEAPTAVNFTSAGLNSATAVAGASVGTLSAVDPDVGDTHTFSLALGNGSNDADNGKFTMLGNTLKVGATPLAAGSYHVLMRATDAGGYYLNQAKTIVISLANMAPVITSGASGSVAENAATSTVVYTATATDAESDALTYALTGTDAASFSIDTAGAVRLLSPANFEVKSSYSFTINARDATHTTTQAVTLNVTDVNEAPSDISLSNSSVAENTATASALTIGSLTSADPDAGNTFTYSVVGGADQARFQLSGANLQFKAGTTLDYETQNSYAVTVRSTDQGGLSFDKVLTISLSNVNEKPLISSPAAQNVTQGVATALTGISLADPDAGSGLLSLSVSGEPAVFNASNGGGVTVSGAGSPSITLTGSQANLNAFIAAGRLTATTPAGMAGPFTITLDSDDNGLSGAGGAKQDSKTLTLNGVAAPVVSPPSSGGNSNPLFDGVEVTSGSVWRADGRYVPSLNIPVIPRNRVDQDPSSPNADIPLAGSSSAPAIKAEIPVGIGMTSIGGDSTKTDKTDLITAIKSRTVDKSADQNSMVDLGNFFLKTLPNSVDLWVRTVVISADSSKDAAGSLVFRGQTSDSNTDTALVLDFSNLPKNSKVSTENIHFAAVVGEVNITTGDGNQLLIADNKAQTLDLGAGNDTVYSGAGDDVLNNSKGNDKLFGQGGNDTFNAENGQNTLHGGTDSDTAKFTGKRADYTVERHDGYVKVINNADTSKSTLVVNVETLQFADSSETIQARDELKVLAGSYLQVLGRQADVYGFDYFGDLQSKGYSLGGIAINMIKSDEAKARGFVLTGDAVNDVEMLYKAILGRESDAGGKAAWVQQMQSGGMTLEQVANAFMVSGEMQKHYLVQTGWDFLL